MTNANTTHDDTRVERRRETRIVLADDHCLVREALRRLIESRPDLIVVAEASDGLAAVEAVEKHRPDIAVIDLWMPELSGIETTRRITRTGAATRIIILTQHGDWARVRDSLHSGASGYVVKTDAAAQLLEAIDSVRAGRSYISPAISHHVVEAMRGGGVDKLSPLDALSDREREVLQLVAEGLSAKEIAARLGLSVKTAEAHRSNIMGKLGIRRTSLLVRFAIREGVIAP
ncbi:MAG: DNA-binding response regulator [Proteobacteria bacterium]|nr:MAG: DNA-binding response regulator [Pseudomonadota bacterium]